MRVIIGPYHSYWTTQVLESWWYKTRYDKYDWEINKKDWDRWDRAFEAFTDFWQFTVCAPVNWLKNKCERKIKIKIHDYDTWSMDATLAPIILPMLKQLNKTKHGAPWTNDEDVPEELRSTAAPPKENEYDTDVNHFLRWDWIIGEMIWAFEQLVDEDNDDQFCSGESDIMWQAIDKNDQNIDEPHKMGERPAILKDNDAVVGYKLVDGPNHTYACDYEKMKAHHDRIDNGLRLFGVHFRALWD
jgi:hypothetical protein